MDRSLVVVRRQWEVGVSRVTTVRIIIRLIARRICMVAGGRRVRITFNSRLALP
jgi:hypothetical protein